MDDKSLKEIVFRRTKRAREEIKRFGEHSSIGSNAIQRWRVYESLLEAAGLMSEYEEWEQGQDPTDKKEN